MSAEFNCERSDREYSVLDADYGVPTVVTMRDFQPLVSLLLIDGDAIQPRVGDRFIEGDETFEIQPPDANTPAAELRSGGFDWICRTKRVEQ